MKNTSSFLQFQLGIHKNQLSNGPYVDGKKIRSWQEAVQDNLKVTWAGFNRGKPKALFDLWYGAIWNSCYESLFC